MNRPLVYLKFRNGEDVLAEMLPCDDQDYMIVQNPICIMYDAEYGVWSKRWAVLADNEIVVVKMGDVLTTSYPSDLAVEYYKEFGRKKSSAEQLEELFEEKSESTIH